MRKEAVREDLAKLEENVKYNFEAVYSKTGINKRFRDKKTILLLDIFIVNEDGSKQLITDHTWVPFSKRWNNFLQFNCENEKIKFTAELKKYFKEGNREFFENYTLGNVRSIKKLEVK